MELDDAGIRYSSTGAPGTAYEYVSYWTVYVCLHDYMHTHELIKPDRKLLPHRVIKEDIKFIVRKNG